MHPDIQKREGKAGNKNLWHHVPRMSAMNLQTTSQHIRVRVRITSRPITVLEERERLLWSVWGCKLEEDLHHSPMCMLHLHHMTQSHKWIWNCSLLPKVFLKGKKNIQLKRNQRRGVGGVGGLGDKDEFLRELERKGRKYRRWVLLHTSGWVTTST